MSLNERFGQISSPSQGGSYELLEMPVMGRWILPNAGRCVSAQFQAWSQQTD